MISIKNLNKTYFGGSPLHVLKGINLHIDKGEFLSIMGASGSGKSTLLNILGILDTYDTGEYYLDNILIRNLSETRAAELRNKKIGFIFQSFNLISFKNALENVALPLYYQGVNRKKRNILAMEYLDKMGLKSHAEHLPNELSGGQKQRVAIARALIAQPQIILADEPTGALDSKTSEDVMHILREVNTMDGITMIIVTHELEVAQATDRIIHIKDGIISQNVDRKSEREAENELESANQKSPENLTEEKLLENINLDAEPKDSIINVSQANSKDTTPVIKLNKNKDKNKDKAKIAKAESEPKQEPKTEKKELAELITDESILITENILEETIEEVVIDIPVVKEDEVIIKEEIVDLKKEEEILPAPEENIAVSVKETEPVKEAEPVKETEPVKEAEPVKEVSDTDTKKEEDKRGEDKEEKESKDNKEEKKDTKKDGDNTRTYDPNRKWQYI